MEKQLTVGNAMAICKCIMLQRASASGAIVGRLTNNIPFNIALFDKTSTRLYETADN